MGKARILAIAPYLEMAEVMHNIADKTDDYSVEIQVANLANCERVLSQIPANSYDIIVSRGGTAAKLATLAKVPVVEISVSVYDALRALRMVENYTGKFAVVGYSKITDCVAQLSSLLQYEMGIYTYTKADEIQTILEQAKSEHCELVLCDTICAQMAGQMGLTVMLITSDDKSIAAAFQQADSIVRTQKHSIQENQMLRAIVEMAKDDYVVLSSTGVILFSSITQFDDPEPVLEEVKSIWSKSCSSRLAGQTTIIDGKYVNFRCHKIQLPDEEVCCVKIICSDYLPYLESKGVLYLNNDEEIAENFSINENFFSGTTRQIVEQYAQHSAPLILLGEKGVGKTETCSMLHRRGPFSRNPLVLIDCKTTPPKQWKFLLNHEQSPFASTGITINIANIHCLPRTTAKELLDFMHHTSIIKRNRLLFTQEKLNKEHEGNYMLHYLESHFGTIVLTLPALREQQDHITNVAILYLNRLNLIEGRSLLGFESGALQRIQDYSWPGNLAQLYRIVRTLSTATTTPFISEDAVSELLQKEVGRYLAPVDSSMDYDRTLAEIDYDIITHVLHQNNKNQKKTAEKLGISRSTLWRILKSPPSC